MYTQQDNMKLAIECGTYKWQVWQVENYLTATDIPMACFFHEEDARVVFNYLCDKYSIRFVITNVRTKESEVG